MTVACTHPASVTGVVDLDLIRKTPDKRMYTACLSVAVCPDCGHVELYAHAAQYLCDWLTGKRDEMSKKAGV